MNKTKSTLIYMGLLLVIGSILSLIVTGLSLLIGKGAVVILLVVVLFFLIRATI